MTGTRGILKFINAIVLILCSVPTHILLHLFKIHLIQSRSNSLRSIRLTTFTDRCPRLKFLRLSIQGQLFDNRVESEAVVASLCLFPELALDAVLHRIQYGVDGHSGFVGRLGPFLIYTCPHKDGIPVIFGFLIEQVRTADITLRGIANEVDSLGRTVDTMLVFAPLLQESGSEFESTDLGFSESNGVQFLAFGDVFEEDFDCFAESSHAETYVVVGCGPDNVVV
jgi:hypothetical protein